MAPFGSEMLAGFVELLAVVFIIMGIMNFVKMLGGAFSFGGGRRAPAAAGQPGGAGGKGGDAGEGGRSVARAQALERENRQEVEKAEESTETTKKWALNEYTWIEEMHNNIRESRSMQQVLEGFERHRRREATGRIKSAKWIAD